MSELRIIAETGDLCGEGPLWDPAAQVLYWTDITGRKFYRYDWVGGRHELVHAGLQINGFRQNRAGGFVITNAEGIWLWTPGGAPKPVVLEVDGSKCQMNDCTADAAGRLLSGSQFYDPEKPYERGKLIRVDQDGRGVVLDEGFELSNGLGFSPDGKTLYFTDSVARRIYAYDYDVAGGAASRRRVFVQVPREEGIPDGLAVDAEGYVWSAQWYGGCVVRYDPEGKVERRIPVPAKQTSSLAFGGPDLTDIFITSAGRSEPMPCMPPGYDAVNGNFGGQLYHIHLGIAGQAQPKADIRV
jgi:D-xylonolactonase